MLAPGRFSELIRDRRDTAAAVANATIALRKGLSAKNQKFVFMLIISSIQRPAFRKKFRIFPARDLAKPGSRARSCTHETLERGERKSPFDWAFCSHRPRGHRVSRRRTLGPNARSVLGGNCNAGGNAIHSRRDVDALQPTHSRYGPRRVGRGGRGALLWIESDRISCRDLSHRLALLWVSSGEDRLSLCRRYAGDHRFDSAFESCMDYRRPPIQRGFGRNHRRSYCYRIMAGTICDCRGERG